MANRFTDGWSPEIPHLARSGEIADLRRDVEGAFDKVEGLVSGMLHVELIDVTPPASGVDTATVGLRILQSPGGLPYTEEVVLEFAVFDDEDAANPAAAAVLQTASKGTILAGSGTAALKVKTDANGEFECQCSDGTDETVYLASSQSFKSPALDCADTESVTFIP